MPVKISILGTGSSGNGVLVKTPHGTLLVDVGFTRKDMFARARKAGMDPTRISAAVISHAHQDHAAGIAGLHKELKVPVYATEGTIQALGLPRSMFVPLNGGTVQIAGCQVRAFAVPHDCFAPVAFRIEAEGQVIVVATDLGCITSEVNEHLKGCDLLIIEANHDLGMLEASARPLGLKRRIASNTGHLSNRQVADWLTTQWDGKGRVVLAHLSREANTPALALRSAMRAVVDRGIDPACLSVSGPGPMELIEL